MAKKTFDFSQPKTAPATKKKSVASLDVLSKETDPLEDFKLNFVNSLIGKLKSIYDSDKWKYRLIKNAKQDYNFDLQYIQLNNFEKGKNTSSNIISLILSEVNKVEKETIIKINNGDVKI
jgi:hypothetical protein